MQSKLSILIGCGLLLANVAAGGQAKAGAGKISDGIVKVGVITDLSGLYSDLSGQGSIIAAQMAVNEFGGKVL
jgi:branched-chain amino acid transport system substrate-binding protein